ncbi:MAG: hypothetical protein B0D92_05485 [Spirochaeta sp. LUC14_002_19_P3]|nr:MAG: hypothetical protein B0D92_05485 [Spirochaeta sp. LUC14_002_19_P3]
MITQQSLKRRIKQIERDIAVERENESEVLTNFGKAIYELGGSEGLGENILTAIANAKDEIAEFESCHLQMLEMNKQIESINEEKKLLNSELQIIKVRILDYQENLARKALEFWQSGHGIKELDHALEDIIKAKERLNGINDDVVRHERLTEKLGSSILSRGKSFLLSGRRKSAIHSMERLWVSTGAKIYETVDMSALQGTKIEDAARELKAVSNRKQEINTQLLNYAAMREKIDADLDPMPGKGSLSRRIGWVENALTQSGKVLDSAYRELAELWLSGEGESVLNTDAAKLKDDWEAVRGRIAKLEANRQALVAHYNYLEIELNRNRQNERVLQLDDKMSKLQDQLKQAKKELSVLDKKLITMKDLLPELEEEEA